ncbi:alpha/beta hydrolase [Nocardia crassostreae]|uniref:alpha/beta hydrolase n=1 Tax=Nocardia crassostreae TaxID=53428 RepID=UPI00083057A1|nr:alpha/beta hydrolase family protein [Nocardia crassostreae]
MTVNQRRATFAAVLTMGLLLVTARTAEAEPANISEIVRIAELSPERSQLSVYSAAMRRMTTVDVLHPAGDALRPAYYLLDGVDTGPAETNWTQRTDIVSFFADKNVNVMLPIGGKGSYYTDWQRPEPALGGELKWETFLTEELPPLIDERFHGTGRNAIGGLSMGAASAAVLATRHPALYRGLAMFSGCPDTLSDEARMAIRHAIGWVGGNPDNMWGWDGDPAWAAHDPMTNAAALAGKTVYVSSGNGMPGLASLTDPLMPQAVTFGAILEYGIHDCTIDFQRRIAAVGVRANFVLRPDGTHSWPYWQQDLHDSWPFMNAALSE